VGWHLATMVLPFKLSIAQDSCEAEKDFAKEILDQVARKKNSLIGLATGQTMIGVYEILIKKEHKSPGLFKEVVFAQLDEIIPNSDRENLFSLQLKEGFLNRLKGGYASFLSIDVSKPDLTLEASRYLSLIASLGGIDLQILGIGVNGHVGYNEPGSKKDSRCRVVKLAPTTIERAGYTSGMQGITLGISDILKSKRIALLATGIDKAAAISGAIKSTPSIDNPASLLVTHNMIKIILDSSAGSFLTN